MNKSELKLPYTTPFIDPFYVRNSSLLLETSMPIEQEFDDEEGYEPDDEY